jgi:hypothetical protein
VSLVVSGFVYDLPSGSVATYDTDVSTAVSATAGQSSTGSDSAAAAYPRLRGLDQKMSGDEQQQVNEVFRSISLIEEGKLDFPTDALALGGPGNEDEDD